VVSSDKNERRAAVDKIRRDQKRADQRQGMVIIGVCVIVAVLIVAVAAYRPVKEWWDKREFAGKPLQDIGAPASVCGERTTKSATGSQQHVAAGTAIDYPEAPPAFGQHEEIPDSIGRKLYTEDDRPRVEQLVHNLEHGYTILWYDDTVAEDSKQFAALSAIADLMKGGKTNYRLKFKAVPWTKDDGKAFPSGQHVALTHWASKSEEKDDKNKDQVGVWQYCSEVSGAALKQFMLDYPYTNSPEPDVE